MNNDHPFLLAGGGEGGGGMAPCNYLRNNVTQPPGTFSLYWYRGVTVLLYGIIWKYWNCPCKFFSLGSLLMSTLSIPNGGEGNNSSIDFMIVKKPISCGVLVSQPC
jgi:hypothetical protein